MTKRKGKNQTIRPQNGSAHHASEVEVDLEFVRPTAAAVFVAGTFNDWRPTATPMIAIPEGRWIKQLRLPPGRYEYCLVVDGEWMPDPLARECVPNPFGGFNSVLRVAAPK